MATSIRPTAPVSEALQFRPRWWWDPVPDWVLEHLSSVLIREIAVIQMKTQVDMLKVQQGALEQTMAVLRKAK
jgi:hypothetical protein